MPTAAGLPRLTKPVPPLSAEGGGRHSPAWSPDGTQIAFSSRYESPVPATIDCDIATLRQEVTEYSHIYVMNAAGGGLTSLTKGAPPVFDNYPAWSPDGSQIAFSGGPAGQQLYVINVDGNELKRLTDAPASMPAWSPDGSQIAFVLSAFIHVMNADGTELRNLGLLGPTPRGRRSDGLSRRRAHAATPVREELTMHQRRLLPLPVLMLAGAATMIVFAVARSGGGGGETPRLAN